MNDLMIELEAMRMPIYAVFDGAVATDIEERFRAYRLPGQSIFRENTKRETALAGSWLVSILDGDTFANVMSASCAFGKSVFWVGDCSEEELIRHLRVLNAAQMPDGRVVFFRHYDSDVLASIITIVDEKQAACLFGPAKMIGLFGGRASGATVLRPDGLPLQQAGPINFYDWQIDHLNQRQQRISRLKIARMLRNILPASRIRCKSDDQLVDPICDECLARGMRNETSLGIWCCLHYWSNGVLNEEFMQKLDNKSDFDGQLRIYFDRISRSRDVYASAREYFE